MSKRILWSVLISLSLAALACNMPGIGTATEAAVEVTEPTADPLSPEQNDATVPPPIPTSESGAPASFTPLPEGSADAAGPASSGEEIIAPPTTPDQNASYEGISFFVDYSALASEWVAETQLASDPQTPGAMPSHYYFTFNGYVGAESYYTPGIWVIPTENFDGFGSGYDTVPSDLEALLRENRLPTDEEYIPFLPGGAGEVFSAQVARIQFQNGRGFRFLMERSQAVSPVSNDLLFYGFQGLTWDGAYYIAAILPIQNSTIPALAEDPGDSIYADGTSYQAYLDGILPQLEAASGDSFTPSLNTLDTLIGSLQVGQ